MNQVRKTKTGFFIGLAVYAIVVEVTGLFLTEDVLSFTLGLAFGVAASVFLFCHMEKTLDYALDLGEEQAGKYIRFQSFLRIFVMLAILTIGMITTRLNFIAVVLGLFGLKIGALTAPLILKKVYPEDFVTPPEAMVVQEDEEDLDNEE